MSGIKCSENVFNIGVLCLGLSEIGQKLKFVLEKWLNTQLKFDETKLCFHLMSLMYKDGEFNIVPQPI